MGLGRVRDGLAATPPMGWNSWNRFQTNVDERLIRETADALVETGMRDLGYRYLVIDDGWEATERDSQGDLASEPDRFPSGMAALAEQVRARALRFGIYTDAGTATCAGYPGSQGHELRDAGRFASWGVDYVKVDWCNTSGLDTRPTYAKWSEAFRAAGRPMVLSVCEWGRTRPWEWAAAVGHLWRTTGDILDTWDSLVGILDRQRDLHPYAGPDHWNDPDMLEVGNGGMTLDEYRAHFSFWCLLAAPLMAGNDLRAMQEGIREMLTAPEPIAVDQDPLGRQGRPIRIEEGAEIWARELADGSQAAILFNRGPDAIELAVKWTELDWDPRDRVAVRDLWDRADVGRMAEGHAMRIPSHGVAMLRLTREEAA